MKKSKNSLNLQNIYTSNNSKKTSQNLTYKFNRRTNSFQPDGL
jgi:hypothetical protein